MSRRLPLPDAPKILRQGDESKLSEILQRPNLHIGNSTQQLSSAKESESSVQILNSALDECKQNITTVARRGNEENRKLDDFSGENGSGGKKSQWYES